MCARPRPLEGKASAFRKVAAYIWTVRYNRFGGGVGIVTWWDGVRNGEVRGLKK